MIAKFKSFKAELLIGALLIYVFSSCESPKKETFSGFETSATTTAIRTYYQQMLDSAEYYLTSMDTSLSIAKNQQLFAQSRKWYKKSEPILIAYDHENYKTINGPNLLKIEVDDYTDIKRIQPKSYQVLEELLFMEGEWDANLFSQNVNFLKARLPFISLNHMIYRQNEVDHLKLVRDAIVNVATKGITGFDSPARSASLEEAIYTYQSIRDLLIICNGAFIDEKLLQEWGSEIDKTIRVLKDGDFDSFDRYSFIKNHTNAQLDLINKTALDWGISPHTSRTLTPTATNLFSKDFFNVEQFAPPHSIPLTEELVNLGKVLFNDKNLSLSRDMSCATCHQQDKAFTDGRKLALGNDGKNLLRNSPTLSYSTYQHRFFYDGSGAGLEGQIINVISNPKEFHLNLDTMIQKINENPWYKEQFNNIYKTEIDGNNSRNAIASYIRSLAPFNSKFDRNIQGLEETLSEQEITGFNLFMGKAACGTCHFAPAFYGTVPPRYDETEFENLGVPETADFDNPTLDDDLGMYNNYQVDERKYFFKTATVRNITLTAPYMHNGVFQTLEEVMEFYNKGGGVGLGLENPYQTLPATPLNLTNAEIEAVIAFMKTLTDSNLANY